LRKSAEVACPFVAFTANRLADDFANNRASYLALLEEALLEARE
jgi:hypothetical protein